MGSAYISSHAARAWLRALALAAPAVCCAGCVHSAAPAVATDAPFNVEVEMLFEQSANTVTSAVSYAGQQRMLEPSLTRRRVLRLWLPAGAQQLVISQVFETVSLTASLMNSGSGAGTTLEGDCFSEAMLEVPEGAQLKLRQLVHETRSCELSCEIERAGTRTPIECRPALASRGTSAAGDQQASALSPSTTTPADAP